MSWEMLPDIAWKSAVTLGVTLALLFLFRRRSAAQRAWIAHIGLLATLLLPLASAMLPRWEVEAAAPMAELAAPVSVLFATPAAVEAAAPVMAPLPAPMAETVIADPAMIALLIWGLPAVLLLLVMLVAVVRLFALARRAAVLVEQSWLTALAQAQVRMNFKHGAALLVSREIASPVSWGVLRPVILINAAALESRAEAEAIIAHELAHVVRLDWAGLLLARIVTALFWFNPLAWMVARQAHQLREEAADDAVLRSDVDRLDYAALLVGAARHEARGFLLAANGVAPSAGSLKRRITRVLDEHQLRAPAYLGWMSACALGAGVVALPLAAFSATRPAEMAQAVQAVIAAAPQVTLSPVVPTPPVVIAQTPRVPVAPRMHVTPPVPAAAPDEAFEHSLQAFALDQAARALDKMGQQIAANAARTAAQERLRDANAVAASVPVPPVPPIPPASSAEAQASADKPTADDLIQMAVLGIPARYRQEIAAAGYPGLNTSQLHKMQLHGVRGAWLRDLAAVGYDRLTLSQITNFAIHRVDADFALRMQQMASARPSPDQLVKLRIFNGRMPGADSKDKNKNKRFDD